MPLPLPVSCFTKIQIGFTFLVPAHLGSPGKGQLKGCVCVCSPTEVRVSECRLIILTIISAAWPPIDLMPEKHVFSFVRQLTTWHSPMAAARRVRMDFF